MSADASIPATLPTALALAFASQRLSEPCLVALLGSLLEPLEAIHRAGRTHANISPHTILWSRAEGPLLSPALTARTTAADNSLQLQVHPGFTPPETYQQHGALGPWSDLYSLGALAYWLMTGTPPPDAPSRAIHDTCRALSLAEGSSYSAALRSLVDTLLALPPPHRLQDVAALRTRLAPLQAITAPPPATATQPVAYAPDPAQLDAVRALLTRHLLGPVATALINQAVRKSSDWSSVCSRIASHLDDEKLRGEFLDRFAGTPPDGLAVPAANNNTSTPDTFPAAMLEALEAELKGTLGAVARLVVRKAANRAPHRAALFAAIAAEIENPVYARQFLTWAEATLGTSREQ